MSNNAPVQLQLPIDPPLPGEAVRLKAYVRRMAQTVKRGSHSLRVGGKTYKYSCEALDALMAAAGSDCYYARATFLTYRELLNTFVSCAGYCFNDPPSQHNHINGLLGFQVPERKRWILLLNKHFDEMYWDMINCVPRAKRRINFH